MKKIIFLFLAFYFTNMVNASEVDEIISNLERNYRGDSIYLKMKISVHSRRGVRQMIIETFGKGTDKSFTKLLYPQKNKGITFLRIKNQLWQYVPKIDRIIKIPPSMMLQRWMGTDFTNDDIVRESSMADDYNYRIINKDAYTATIEFTPKSTTAVVWGKIISTINTQTYTQEKSLFYDDDNSLVREINYTDVKLIDNHNVALRMVLLPSNNTSFDNKTVVDIIDVKYDHIISNKYFTRGALKKFSRDIN